MAIGKGKAGCPSVITGRIINHHCAGGVGIVIHQNDEKTVVDAVLPLFQEDECIGRTRPEHVANFPINSLSEAPNHHRAIRLPPTQMFIDMLRIRGVALPATVTVA